MRQAKLTTAGAEAEVDSMTDYVMEESYQTHAFGGSCSALC